MSHELGFYITIMLSLAVLVAAALGLAHTMMYGSRRSGSRKKKP